jgi:ornithine cyclodeaminase
MIVIEREKILESVVFSEVIDSMRDALIAQGRGECDTPMPMHIDVSPENAEVHIKASYRHGGKYFGMKVASTFPNNLERGITVGPGAMMLFSAETGEPAALLCDNGYLTDVRTAAVGAMVAREIGRTDEAVGVIGTGIQGRFQVRMLAEITALERAFVYDVDPKRVRLYVKDMSESLPDLEVVVCKSPIEVVQNAKLIVTVTPARTPHFKLADISPGTHINAVGSDTPGKNEHDPEVLRATSLLLVDSLAQSQRLGELQHAPDASAKAIEIGNFCENHVEFDENGITFCDMTGLGVEDLAIAQYCYEKSS